MSAHNNVSLTGNLGQDAEVRQAGKTTVTTFSLATNDGWGDNKKTNWHNLEIWGERGERIAQYLTKGANVTVQGSLDYQSWEGEDGNKKYKTVIRVNDLGFNGKREGASNGTRASGRRSRRGGDDFPAQA